MNNHEHRTKQTYESYTFQTLMSFLVSANKESIKLYNVLQQVTLKGLRIPHSGFRIPDSWFQISHSTNPTKTWLTVDKLTFTAFSVFFAVLRLVKTIATWKTVIKSMQSLGMHNFRVAFARFLAFYSDNPSGLHDGETPAKCQSKASFATHPSTETEWPPKLLTRFSSWISKK